MSTRIPLAIDMTSGAWRHLVAYVDKRIAQLAEICTSTTASDDERRVSAHRIQELRDLIDAPRQTLRATEQRSDGPSAVY